MQRTRRAGLVLSLLMLAVLAGSGCGDDGLEAVSAQLTEIESEVDQARIEVERRDAEASQAGDALERAREALEEAEQRFADASERVAKAASDAVVFRAVQQRLLDDGDLEGVAISARVQRRTVTLEGSVPSEALKLRAQEVASGATGVETVINQITIDVAAPPR
jgi:osmotically-inducible protein OsmY